LVAQCEYFSLDALALLDAAIGPASFLCMHFSSANSAMSAWPFWICAHIAARSARISRVCLPRFSALLLPG
jgi:hypothetical protein